MIVLGPRSVRSQRIAGSLALGSAFAVLAFAAAPAGAASGDHFTCRGSAVRVQGAGALNVEPEVANPSSDPCATSHTAIANVNLPSLLSAAAGPASTASTPAGGSATSQVANANLLALGVTADAASATASYSCSNGSPVPASNSNVVNLSIGGGTPITASGPMSLSVGGLADVELNRTITSASSITRRAVDITVSGGPYNGAEIVLGEATAGLSGNPCDQGTTDLKPPGVQGGPPSSTPSTTTFTFTFPPGTTLQCSLDGHPFAPCNKTTTFTSLTIGWHVLSVRDVQNGVVGPTSTFRWKVTGAGSAAGCPRATGQLRGRTLGRVSLGMTRGQSRRAYRLSSSWSTPNQDFFCLAPIGVRVEYASSPMLQGLSAGARGARLGRVVLALSANTHYAIAGIRHGASLAAARRALGAGNLFHLGVNWWYFVTHQSWTVVLKLHHGIVAEVGIADPRLTNNRQAQLVFMRQSR